MLNHIRKNKKGQSMPEYALVLASVSAFVIIVAAIFANNIEIPNAVSTLLTTIGTELTSI